MKRQRKIEVRNLKRTLQEVTFEGGPWNGKRGKLLFDIITSQTGTGWLRFESNGYVTRGKYVRATNYITTWKMVWQPYTNILTPN